MGETGNAPSWLPRWFVESGTLLQWLIGIVGVTALGAFAVWVLRKARPPATGIARWVWMELSQYKWTSIECAESVSVFQEHVESRIDIDSLGRGKATIWLRFVNRCPWPVEVTAEKLTLLGSYSRLVSLGPLEIGPLSSSFGTPGNEIGLGKQIELHRDIAVEDVLQIVGSSGMSPGGTPSAFVDCTLQFIGRVKGPRGTETRPLGCRMFIPIYRRE